MALRSRSIMRSAAMEPSRLPQRYDNSGGRATICQCDVSNADQVRAMVDSVSAELGPIDILVNNAAILHRADLDQYDQARFEEMRRVNVGGIINTTAAVAESMKQRRFGRIVNLTSIAAYGTSVPGTTFYAATKAAVIRSHSPVCYGPRLVRDHGQRRRAGLHDDGHGRRRTRSTGTSGLDRQSCRSHDGAAQSADPRISRTRLHFSRPRIQDSLLRRL